MTCAAAAVNQRQSSNSTAERSCVGCRRKGMRSELLRYVVAAGVVVRDERKRLPGRGAWLHDNPECLRLALTRNAFARTLHIPRTAVISPAMD